MAAERRKQQNYQSFVHYLTGPLWDGLNQYPKEKATGLLLRHLWLLGLRCPSESTFAVINSLLNLTSAPNRPKSTMEKYEALQQLKKDWKKFKTANRDHDNVYMEYQETLPENPADLPAEFALVAFEQDSFVPCRA